LLNKRVATVLILSVLLTTGFNMADLNKLLGVEEQVIRRVAKEYELDDVETNLLLSIRDVENGRQGREFGVLKPEAMRFENDPDPKKSFETQAKWAAGTIEKRFTGDLKAFSERWAPIGAENDPDNLNVNWLPNILDKMRKRGE
jgi:hypothetical protein